MTQARHKVIGFFSPVQQQINEIKESHQDLDKRLVRLEEIAENKEFREAMKKIAKTL